jgi:hypothetical protein
MRRNSCGVVFSLGGEDKRWNIGDGSGKTGHGSVRKLPIDGRTVPISKCGIKIRFSRSHALKILPFNCPLHFAKLRVFQGIHEKRNFF